MYSRITASSFYQFQITYVVTSDDPDWCKESFAPFQRHMVYPSEDFEHSGKKLRVANFSEKMNSRDFDLAVASLCDHSIYDYGTFGFWGAYLAGGHTILAHHMKKKQHRQVKHIKMANITGWEYLEAVKAAA